MNLIILLDPAGICGKRIAPMDPALTLQENIQRAMPLGAGDCELLIDGVRVDPLTDPRMDEPPRPGQSVLLVQRPAGIEVAVAVAAFVFAVAAYALIPKPTVPPITSDSANNRLTGQTNIARVYQAIPDVYGRRRVWPDLIQQTLVEYVDNVKVLTEWLCVSRGVGTITDVRFDQTPLAQIDGATWVAYEPGFVGPPAPGSPPAAYAEAYPTQLPDVFEPFAVAQVDGQEIGLDVSTDTIDQAADLDAFGTSTFTLRFVDGPQFDTIKALAPSGTTAVTFGYQFDSDPLQLGIYTETVTVLSAVTDGGFVTFRLQGAGTITSSAAGQQVWVSMSLATTSAWSDWFYLPVSANRIWWNMAFLRGLQGTIEIEHEIEAVDASGAPLAGSFETDSESYTAASDAPQFFTRKVTPAYGDARYRIRFRRTTASLGNGADTAQLEALFAVRYYGTRAVPGVTVVKLTTRATEQATSTRERKFNLLWQRHVRTLDADTVSASRNFARAMAHLWTISGEDIAELDTAALQTINSGLGEESALLRFDGSLDDADMSLGERMQLIANHARCVLWRDGQKWTVTRDQRRELVELQLDYRNLSARGDSTISVAAHLPASEDGVEVEYVDEATGTKKAYARLNITTGTPVVGTSRTPRRIALPGCTTEAQAVNRAHLEARKLLLQRTSVTDRALEDGALLGPGSLVRWVDPADWYGDDGLQAGEVLAISGSTITTSEPVQWGAETSGRVLFTGADGAYLGAAIACSPGATPDTITLAAAPPVGLYVADDDRQLGSRYAIAVGVTASELELAGLFTVVDSRPQGDGEYALQLVNYTDAIYAFDLVGVTTIAGGVGEAAASGVRAAIDDGSVLVEPGVGTAVASGPSATVRVPVRLVITAGVGITAASGQTAAITPSGPQSASFSDGAVNGFGGAAIAGVRFRATGDVAQAQGASAGSYADYARWFNGTVSGSWWVRFSTTSAAGGTVGGSDTGWLALSSDRTVTLTAPALESASATITWQIAADSAGTNVRATGAISLVAVSVV